MSSVTDLLSSPSVSLLSIPAVWATVYYPHVTKNSTISSVAKYDNVSPRGNIDRLQKKDVNQELLARVKRMDGAHSNGLESFPFYCSAVLTANFAGLDTKTTNVACISFFALRVFYNFVYINQRTRSQSIVRTLTWASSISVSMFLIVKSALVVGSK